MAAMTDFRGMTVEEKLSAMEALWDDLCRHEENIPVPNWQKEILDERERAIKEGRSKFVDWDTAKKQIIKKFHEG